ncbi:hypothetical protein LCGC14_0334590 [marine sediment metagenome]|uniref:Uncharacterized protein n=1 Tax=marine sediment metagenome TaxID=412755 RepID=A0A0F9W2R7_9ZZZZ
MSLLETTHNPKLAPVYARHRVVEGAIDTGTITEERRAMNMASHSHAHVQVIPTNGANPDVKVLFWSEAANRFIDPHPDQEISFGGAGPDVPYEFTFEPRGRKIFIFVTGTVTGDDVVEIQVAGYNVERV